MGQPDLKVFVSSTNRDLFAHRKAVHDAIMRLKHMHPIGMEFFGAQDGDATEVSLKDLTRFTNNPGTAHPKLSQFSNLAANCCASAAHTASTRPSRRYNPQHHQHHRFHLHHQILCYRLETPCKRLFKPFKR